MKAFDTVEIAITPLTPIHIGCGEDFEPTNYVIDAEGHALFAFDPSRAVLNETQRGQLNRVARSADLQGIQNFFRNNPEPFMGCADQVIPVTPEIGAQYHKQLGRTAQTVRDGNNVINRMYINRTTSNPLTGEPYLPGSSLKGAIRTAMLDRLNNGRHPTVNAKQAGNWEKELLGMDGNKFAQSIFRLIKVSDATAETPRHQIVMARQYKKKIYLDDGNNDLLSARKEIIQPAQYRAFKGEITLQSLTGVTGKAEEMPARQLGDITAIAKDCNRYYQEHFERSLSILRTLQNSKLISAKWLASLESLYEKLLSKLSTGKAFLMQLGQYGGAESKTFSGGVAQIKIMHGRKSPATYEPVTSTIWLTDCSNQAGNQPFGWALVEINPADDLSALKQWCEQQQAALPDTESMKQKLSDLKQTAEQRKTQLAQEQVAKEAKQKAEEAEAARKVAELAAMPAGKRLGTEISALLTNVKAKDVGASEVSEAKKQLETAVSEMQKGDRSDCIAAVKSAFKKKDLLSKKNKEFFKNLEN